MMTFLNPLDALIPKIPFSFSADFHLRGPGVSLGRILGGASIEPLLGGGSSQGALSISPPLQLKARLPQQRPPGAPVGAVSNEGR